MIQLNEGQEKAKSLFKQFLFDDGQKYFCIDAPPGFGKSTLLNHLHDELQDMNKQLMFLGKGSFTEMLFAATTNKAASVLNNAKTIHKLFGLSVFNDYKTGKSVTKATGKTVNISNAVIAIDEASMISPVIADIIGKYTQGSKVIYVGDSDQLAPVGHNKPYVFDQGYPTATLTEPMRQGKDSFLYQSCLDLRDAVRSQVYKAPKEGEGITFLDAAGFKAKCVEVFQNQEDARILAYTNKQVESLNNFVRRELHRTDGFRVGDPVVAASACEGRVKVEETYNITSIGKPYHDGTMEVQDIELDYIQDSFVAPVNKLEYFAKVKRAKAEAKQDGDWTFYFELINNYLDIRDGFACTVNKSQGSTYDTVLIDFSNLCICKDLNTFLRLLYVAVSRAKHNVFVYGL